MTNAEMAILTVLAEHPRHGYEIEAIIEERGMRDWTEVGFSSIYYLLKKLEGRGLVEGIVSRAGSRGPARVTYQLTEAGAAALRSATLSALSVPQPGHSPFLLGLANLPCLTPEEIGTALMQYQTALTVRREQVQQSRERDRTAAPSFVIALFDRTLALIDAELAWLAKFASQSVRKEVSAMPQPLLPEKVLYTAKKDPEIVMIPETWCLTMSGIGAPESQVFRQAVGALFGLAYTLKFKLKPTGLEFKVPALEGLWWVEGECDWQETPRDQWRWKLLIRMPDAMTAEQVAQARSEAATKKKDPAILQVQCERFAEGLVAQLLHMGPFSEERPNIDRLHAFIAEQGYRPRGLHHEIYLSDFTRTAPEKLKTILRQPVEPV